MNGLVVLFGFFLTSLLFGNESKIPKNQTLYLALSGELDRSILLYQNYVKESGKHDFSILEQLGSILIRQGIQSEDEYCNLLSMYGLSISDSLEGVDLYEVGIVSTNPIIQIATIHFLTPIQDDRVDPMLCKAFHSPYLEVQLEAAYALAVRKSVRATEMIDALMQKLPPYFHVYFPELFCMIGTADAMCILKRMIDHCQLNIRLATILAIAKFERDDFLQEIRAIATHSNQAEQEVCAAALGHLQDSHSIPLLKTLAQSPSIDVKLAACQALMTLGEHAFYEPMMESARQKNLLAISTLDLIPHAEPLLLTLLEDQNFQVQANSAIILLRKRNPKCIPVLLKILLKDERDLGFQPISSLGHALTAWKIIPSFTQHVKNSQQDIHAVSLALREQILLDALELPEPSFLNIARELFAHKQNDLIPLLVCLLANLNTPNAIALLQEESLRAGAPFIRTYCHLVLYDMNNENVNSHKEILYSWIEAQKDCELVRFRTVLPWIKRTDTDNNITTFQLTPEETSRLMLETLEVLAKNYDMRGIDILLEALRLGNPKNRYAIAGLLLKSIQ